MSWQSMSYGGSGGAPSSGGSSFGGGAKPSSGGSSSGGGGYGGCGARPTPSNSTSQSGSHSGSAGYGGSAPTARPTASSGGGCGGGGSGGGGGGGSSAPQNLQVSGCGNPTVANIIKGPYSLQGTNHGKPFYKKEGPPGTVNVLIYFWDERDGSSFSGWWFGPKVGGDQVWAYNGAKASPTPPLFGWKVPWDGPIDDALKISASGSPSGGDRGSTGGSQNRAVPPRSGDPREQRDPRDRRDMRDPRAESREHERQRQHEEDQRRRREEAAREAAHREKEKVRQAEEEKRRQALEQQKREEERRRRAQEEERRRREREEEEARKRAEMKKKREEEETRRKEQTAALVVRKVIQRVRIATPENYDQLRGELEEAQAAQLEDMGSQAEKVSSEAEKALQQAQQRIDEINEKRAADERKRLEEEKRKKEEQELVERLMKEAQEEVDAAEKKVTEAADKAKAISEGKEAEPDATVQAAEAVEKNITAVQKELDEVSKSLDAKRREMGNRDAAYKVRNDLSDMERKITDGRRSLDKQYYAMQTAREKAAKNAAALKKLSEKQARFAKHDSDGDGKLSRAEVAAFSVATYQFVVPEEVLAKVMKTLDPVVFEKFDRVRAMVAIAKSEIEARKQRAEAEEKKKARDAAKAEMQKVIDEAANILSNAEDATNEVESKARPLTNKTDSMAAEKIQEDAVAALASTKEVEETLADALAKLTKVEEDCGTMEDLAYFVNRDVPRLKGRHGRVQGRLEKVAASATAAKEKAVRKAYAELEQKKTDVVTAVRGFMSSEGKTAEQLFEHIGAGKELTGDKFTEFLKGLTDFKLEEDQAAKLFTHIAGEQEGISKEMFLDLIRLYFKCVKATVLTEDITIKSKTVRRLDLTEVLEVLEGPTKEEGVNVQRVKVQAVNDAAVGWATIAGNQGTPFLEPGGNLLTCVEETTITDGLSITDSKTVRRLNIKEVVEVLEFGKKDSSTGIKRVKAKAKEDGATGWITVCDNQGTSFLKPC